MSLRIRHRPPPYGDTNGGRVLPAPLGALGAEATEASAPPPEKRRAAWSAHPFYSHGVFSVHDVTSVAIDPRLTMVIPPSARALRRPKVYVSVLLFFTFVLAIGHVNRNSRSPISFNPFAKQPSPYYTQDESKYYTWKTPSFFPPLKDTRGDKKTDFCTGFPTHLLDRIQVVVKTGTGESAKNKAHTASVTSCIENLLVFSDLEEKVGDRNFIDVLADLPQSYNDIPDFATYATQKQAHEQGDAVGYSSEGWRLDRFKFLPMVERAYKMNPDADWYVFIETDVYYFWDTLFRLLGQLDPSKMHYMGSPAPGSGGTFFAYGGAGFVLSGGLMRRLVGDSDMALSVRYEELVKNDCCGDAILGYAIMNKTGVKLEALYPTFAGDELKGLKVDRERWCIPLLALHRVSPELMASLWTWERTRPYNEVCGFPSVIFRWQVLTVKRTLYITPPSSLSPIPTFVIHP